MSLGILSGYYTPDIQTYHPPNNFREMIGDNKILNNKLNYMKPTVKSAKILPTMQYQDQAMLLTPQVDIFIH